MYKRCRLNCFIMNIIVCSFILYLFFFLMLISINAKDFLELHAQGPIGLSHIIPKEGLERVKTVAGHHGDDLIRVVEVSSILDVSFSRSLREIEPSPARQLFTGFLLISIDSTLPILMQSLSGIQRGVPILRTPSFTSTPMMIGAFMEGGREGLREGGGRD